MNDHDTDMFLEDELDFGLTLLKRHPVDEASVFSPLSIAFALALIHSGADGESKSQIREAIFTEDDTDEDFVDYFRSLSEELRKKNDRVQLNIANRLFLRRRFKPFPSYLDAISEQYGAKAQTLNFADAKGSANTINSFVEKSTGGKIKEAVTPDLFQNPHMKAIIMNALHFKAEWSQKFCKSKSHKRDFWSTEDSKRKIDFMAQHEEHLLYFNDDEAEILTLKYMDNDYGFSIILPNERFELDSFLFDLTAADLNYYFSSVKETLIDAYIPKMKLEKELDLKESLQALGIIDIFGEDADFSALSDNSMLFISDIKHKAVIEVDENGTEAAAVTTARGYDGISKKKPVIFTADHPFLYVLTYKKHPIFMGVFA